MTKVECSQQYCIHRSKAGICKKKKLSMTGRSKKERRPYSANYGGVALVWATCGDLEL